MAFSFKIGTVVANSKIAAFDLDWTLIKPKSGNKFPKNNDDWTVINSVKQFHSDHKIVIFTNQGSSKFNKEEFTKKLEKIAAVLDVPLHVFVATDDVKCRKPCIGLWNMLENDNEGIAVDLENSFMVGDAAGRPNDFSDSDLKFALNIGIKFYTPEFVVVNDRPIHPLHSSLKEQVLFTANDKQEMIIFVGPPGSGKSSIAKQFKGYIIINQDTLGTKAKVLKLVHESLKKGHSVVIDRKNEYKKDREEFINIAKGYNASVRIIWFDVTKELSEHLCTYREIQSEALHIPSIVFNKYYSKEKGLEIPNESEAPVIKTGFVINDILIVDKKLFYSYLV
jgi:bifunctional polynucleotide phosphatase/kinase